VVEEIYDNFKTRIIHIHAGKTRKYLLSPQQLFAPLPHFAVCEQQCDGVMGWRMDDPLVNFAMRGRLAKGKLEGICAV